MKILFIGDPHFKKDNGNETALMTKQMYNIMLNEKPNITIILGDILHYHEKSYTNQHVDSYKFIDTIYTYMPLGGILIILIGNHDRINNKIFLTDEHVFNPYKRWANIYIVDTVTQINYKYFDKEFKILAVPYVEVGKFAEALATKGYAKFSDKLKEVYGTKGFKMSEYLNEITYNMDINLVLSHQEFLKCKMNSIESLEGDYYPLYLPMNVSGHIHEEDELQPNLYYPGSSTQLLHSDTRDKSLSLFIYDENFNIAQRKRIKLDIPKKIQLIMTPQELLTFVPPENSKIKIKLKGNIQENADVMKLDYVIKLQQLGVLIVPSETAHQIVQIEIPPKDSKTNISFNNRLYDYIKTQPEIIQNIFEEIKK